MNLEDLKKIENVDNLHFYFKRNDGVLAHYRIVGNDTTVFINEAEIAEYIETKGKGEFIGFSKVEPLTMNIFDLIPDPNAGAGTPGTGGENGNTETPGHAQEMYQLHINGFDPAHPRKAIADISEVLIADREMMNKDDAELSIQVPTHTISVGQSIINTKLRGLVAFTITDDTGKVWVSVDQDKPTLQLLYGGEYGNNHPSKDYIPGLTEESTVSLPIANYKISAKNKGNLPIDFDIIHPWSDNPNQVRRIHQEIIQPGETATYVLNATDLKLSEMKPFERAIKFNLNTANQD